MRWTLPLLALALLLIAGCAAEPPELAPAPQTETQKREDQYLLAVEASSSEAHALGRVQLLRLGAVVCDFAGDVRDFETESQIMSSIGVGRDAASAIVFQAKALLCPEKRYS